jgi:hypothetical protein
VATSTGGSAEKRRVRMVQAVIVAIVLVEIYL